MKQYQIHEPTNLKPKPDEWERITARLMAEYLKSDIEFVVRKSSTTPDIMAIRLNQFWEIKNIVGNSSNTIHNNLKSIDRQSENVVITLFRTKMRARKAYSEIIIHLKKATRIKRLVLITNSKKIIVIK
ncbi:hypothetical protein IKG73_00525 [Candidatus Saccharibacteria bacterium]|nr:hypothetical protein [Candidatus Saccharibacteria bacterium]